MLGLAQLLDAFELRRDALGVLLEGSKLLPASAQIEKQALDLFDRLRDERGREAYLAERVKAFPGRKDLALSRVKSLFLLGRRGEAASELDALVAALDPADRVGQLLDVARYLRRSGLPSDAARVFERAATLAPARLDLRCELADTHLALGDKRRAKEILADALPKDATIENVLDLVPVLIQQELYREARAALAARLDAAPANLDLRLLLLTVESKTGSLAAAGNLILDARRIADTGALYRRWLEAATAHHEVLGTAGDFLDQEQARLAREGGAWTPGRLERRLLFADLAIAHGRRLVGAVREPPLLMADLDSNPPPEGGVRLKLRRRLLDAMRDDAGQIAAAEGQLNDLLREDPQGADEYRARLALLHAKADHPDQVAPLLDAINIPAIQDPALLSSLQPLYEPAGRGDKAIEIVARLTTLDPTNRAHWEQWLMLLAVRGDEGRLRGVVRQLLLHCGMQNAECPLRNAD